MQKYTLEEFIQLNNETLKQSNNFDLLKKVKNVLLEDQTKIYCSQISRGILIRLNINPRGKDLLTFFGDGNDTNNLFAVSNWIYEKNPTQSSGDSEDVTKYLQLYLRHLDDAGVYVDFTY